jgi:uncharacterized membrane protein
LIDAKLQQTPGMADGSTSQAAQHVRTSSSCRLDEQSLLLLVLLLVLLLLLLLLLCLQVLVLAIFFHKTTPTPGLEAAGLISAVVGLVLFLDGLRVAVMPMAMLVGTKLPQRLKLPWVLLVAFFLGVLVTYAGHKGVGDKIRVDDE